MSYINKIFRLLKKTKNESFKFIKLAYIGEKYQCPVCFTKLSYFDIVPDWWLQKLKRYGHIYSINDYETFNLEKNTCPVCKTGDSNRLYAIYLRKRFTKLDTKKKYLFIDFAPVPPLAKLIKSYPSINYRSVDLYMADVDDRIDITDMRIYKNNSVDMFLCSHVLEHVSNDIKAMSELKRILKPSGWGILMVPIMLSIKKNQEDSTIKNEGEKWKYYGQGDHVRMYSKEGFLQRMTKVGFKVEQLGIDYFGAKVFDKYGISPKSILYIVSK